MLRDDQGINTCNFMLKSMYVGKEVVQCNHRLKSSYVLFMLFVLNCVWLIIRIDNHSFSNVEQLTYENHEYFTTEVVFIFYEAIPNS